MASISNTRLQQVIDRFEEVEARMGATSDTAEIIALSKEHAELKPVVAKARELLGSRNGLKEAEALMSSGDKEMAELAEMEIEELKEKLPELEKEMQILSPKVALRFMVFALASLCLFVLAGKEVIRILTLPI